MKRPGPLRRSPLARRSTRKANSRKGRLRDLKADLLARSAGYCEAHASTHCTGVGSQIHHRLRRSQGGEDTLANCIWVDTFCHQEIHDQPARSYARGWLLRRGES